MSKDYFLGNRAMQPPKASHANQPSEPLSRGAIEATDAAQERPALFTPVRTIQEAVQHSLDGGFTDDSLFKFARVLKSFELTHERKLPPPELDSAFADWWRTAQLARTPSHVTQRNPDPHPA